jgi:hypothetical protein
VLLWLSINSKASCVALCLGKTNSLDEKTKIVIPDDRHGLYSCDILDPNVVYSNAPLHHQFHDCFLFSNYSGQSLKS